MSKNNVVKFDENVLKDRIYSMRGFQVMLDRDLAELYGVEVRVLNQAVKRNQERFPDMFCFQLTISEVPELRSQIVISNKAKNVLKSQKISSKKGGRRFQPYVFTEQGVAMLSAVLRSEIAVKISIQIIKAFIEMRKFIQSNAQVFQRLDRVELKQIETDQKFEKVFDALESKDRIPDQGIFFGGQIFDAYKFVSDIFRSAKKSIVIIDNYVDDTVLIHLTKVKKGVAVKIITKSISDQFRLDLKKFGNQYFPIDAKVIKNIQDRFIIIDGSIVYQIGGSLKDLGKKLIAFMVMDKAGLELINMVGEL
ncbi:MAG: ORF6N domain-containing protein [Candidatus Delongbacteria bacterium]|nr:ORF6N domain-containing protein [Candidatus Delongbacteria bacterium]